MTPHEYQPYPAPIGGPGAARPERGIVHTTALPTVSRERRGWKIAAVAGASLLGIAGVGTLVYLGLTRNPYDTASPGVSPSASTTGEPSPNSSSSKPVYPPPPASLCETHGTEEGQIPTGYPTVPATGEHPSIFVVSRDRSRRQSFTARPADNPHVGWQYVTKDQHTGIVGITIDDTVFKTTDGDAIWAKQCLPTRRAAEKELNSRIHDLCNRREFGFSEVVIYRQGANGQLAVQGITSC